MVTDVNPEQPEKADLPIVVTLFGMVTDVNPEHSWKADLPIVVTLLGINVFLHPVTNSFDDV